MTEPGPLHWCEVLEQEHDAITEARKPPKPEPRDPSKAESTDAEASAEREPDPHPGKAWYVQQDDLLGMPGLIDALTNEDRLWAWVARLPGKQPGASSSSSWKLFQPSSPHPKPFSEGFGSWAAQKLGCSPALDNRDWREAGDDDVAALCSLLNALLRQEHLDRAGLRPWSGARPAINWDAEFDQPLEATVGGLSPADVCHRNRLLLEKAFCPWIEPVHRKRTRKAITAMHTLEPVALCLSGGGIRSATFGLGVLQGLARQGLLDKVDYLSTVSGGGFIGSWLTTWLARGNGAQSVADGLSQGTRDPLQPEAKPIAHLRAYSNYLTPKLGLVSPDSWTLVATYLRNLVLIWLVLVPAIMAILVLPRIWMVTLRAIYAPMLAVTVALLVCGFLTILLLGLLRPIAGVVDDAPRQGARRRWRDAGIFLVLLLAFVQPFILCFLRVHNAGDLPPLELLIATTSIGFCIGWYAYYVRVVRAFKRSNIDPPPGLRSAASRPRQSLELLAALVTGAGTGVFIWGFAKLIRIPASSAASTPATFSELNLELFATFGPAAYFLLFFLQTTIFSGVAGKLNDDEDREWWARLAGWTLILATLVTLTNAIVILGPIVLGEFPRIVSALGGVTGVTTLLLGRSAASPATEQERAKLGGGLGRYALAVAAPLFALTILVLLAAITTPLVHRVSALAQRTAASSPTPSAIHTTDRFVIAKTSRPDKSPEVRPLGSGAAAHGNPQAKDPSDRWRKLIASPLPATGAAHAQSLRQASPRVVWLLLAFLLAASVVSSVTVHINRFSMHALYRNRLVRAYLGATNPNRQPHRFTGFDERDNVPLHELKHVRPLHVVNIALNLVQGENLAWQQRKAESFTASPFHAGAARLGYRESEKYAEGLTLGTSVAISGAAVSPNMGYHSSSAVSFLLAFFNIRLGWWLPNPGFPGQHSYTEHSPRFALLPILLEALGKTNARRPWVYLSDGGHFENLGLYEMVRRRCHTIIVSDAGCDQNTAFEDLGNAIRKIRIDLGIPITIDNLRIKSRSEGAGGRYHAVGVIHYDAVDPHAPPGTLVYIKPSICGREPADVCNYARENAAFPHEATSDQWFTEVQFESYRALGVHVIEELSGRGNSPAGTFKEFITRL